MQSPDTSHQQSSPPESSAKGGLRYWVNIAFGLIVIIGIVVGGFFLMEYFYNRSRDKNKQHFIMYSKGCTDFKQDLIISYNESPVGRIDSAVTNVKALQLFVRKDKDLNTNWYVLTLLGDGTDDEAEIDATFSIRCNTQGDITVRPSNSNPLFTIGYDGTLQAHSDSLVVNNSLLRSTSAILRSGDDISFKAQNKHYTLRWNARDLYTRLYCSIDSTQLSGATLLKFNNAALLTHSASISISNTFGLTKTTATFTPTFSPDIVRYYYAGNLTEVQSAGSFDVGDLQNALAYLANRKTMNQAPSSRLERIISSVDSLGMNTASITKNIDATTIPGVNKTISTINDTTIPQVNITLKHLLDSLNLQLSKIEKDFNALTLKADTTIQGIGNDVKPAMKSVERNLDAISEQVRRLREEISKTNKSIKAITDDPVKKLTK